MRALETWREVVKSGTHFFGSLLFLLRLGTPVFWWAQREANWKTQVFFGGPWKNKQPHGSCSFGFAVKEHPRPTVLKRGPTQIHPNLGPEVCCVGQFRREMDATGLSMV